jgi:hypothetical protein
VAAGGAPGGGTYVDEFFFCSAACLQLTFIPIFVLTASIGSITMVRLPTLHQTKLPHANRLVLESIVACVMLAIPGVRNGTPNRTAQALADRHVQNYQDHGTDVTRLILRALKAYQVPAGIEVDSLTPEAANLRVTLANGSVSVLLDTILANLPGYRWIETDGVVNVLPLRNTDSLRQVSVRHFSLRSAAPNEIRATILSLPEVKAWLVRNNVSERSIVSAISVGDQRNNARVSVQLDNLTLGEIMNRIIRTPTLHAWTLCRYGPNRKYISIGFE